MRRRHFSFMFFAAIVFWAFSVAAQQSSNVGAKCSTGDIDWTRRVIVITGVGAPDLKAPNVAVARLGAERVAEMDALRKAIECLKGVHITGTSTVMEKMGADPKLKTRVEGVIRNWKVVDTRYFADGGVEKDIEVGLDGSLVEILIPDAGAKTAALKKAPQKAFSGIVIDATSLDVMPALSPKLYSEDGKLLYGAGFVAKEVIKSQGMVGYFKGVEVAKKSKRAGNKPLVVKAIKFKANSKSDLVISAADSAKIEKAAGVLTQGRVVIAIK